MIFLFLFFSPLFFLFFHFFLSFSSFLLFSPFLIEGHLSTVPLLPSSQWAPSPHHPELQYLQCLVSQFLHLVTRYLVAAPRGMPFYHLALEAWVGVVVGGLSSWVSGDCDNLKDSSWPAANPGLHRQRYTPAFLRKKPLFLPTALAWGGRLLVWSSSGESLLGAEDIPIIPIEIIQPQM